jgi:transposase
VDTQIRSSDAPSKEMSMGRPRRKHSREFKLEAVRLVVEQSRTVRDVAESLGVNASLLQQWKSKLKSEGALAFPGNGRQSAADEEVRRLRKELAQARQERDILKKATAYFAKEQS